MRAPQPRGRPHLRSRRRAAADPAAPPPSPHSSPPPPPPPQHSLARSYSLDAESLQPALLRASHTGAVVAAAFARGSSELVATASADGSVRVWDLSTYAVRYAGTRAGQVPLCLALGGELGGSGALVLSGWEDGAIFCHDPEAPARHQQQQPAGAARPAPNGAIPPAGLAWSIARAHAGGVTAVALTELALLSAGRDGKLRVWGLGSRLCEAEFSEHTKGITAMVVDLADPTRVHTCGLDQQVGSAPRLPPAAALAPAPCARGAARPAARSAAPPRACSTAPPPHQANQRAHEHTHNRAQVVTFDLAKKRRLTYHALKEGTPLAMVQRPHGELELLSASHDGLIHVWDVDEAGARARSCGAEAARPGAAPPPPPPRCRLLAAQRTGPRPAPPPPAQLVPGAPLSAAHSPPRAPFHTHKTQARSAYCASRTASGSTASRSRRRAGCSRWPPSRAASCRSGTWPRDGPAPTRRRSPWAARTRRACSAYARRPT